MFRQVAICWSLLFPMVSWAQSQTPPAAPAAVDGSAVGAAAAPRMVNLPLLELAFTAANAVPEQPHHKTRGKLQYEVVEAALALGAVDLATRYNEEIRDWRRGCGYADLAAHWQAQGQSEQAEAWLAKAESAAVECLEVGEQAWRKDRILAKIASCRIAMGAPMEALALEEKGDPSEVIAVHVARAKSLPLAELNTWLTAAKTTIASGGFEGRQAVMQSGVELLKRSYGEPEVRQQLIDLVALAAAQLPLPLQLELERGLAEAAASHGQPELAKQHAVKASEMALAAAVTADMRLPLVGEVANWAARLGASELARDTIEAGLAGYEHERASVMNIDRADCLRSMAAALVTLGDQQAATLLFWRVVEEGAENPNARPRAEDLVLTLTAMARVGFQPEPKLMERLTAINKALASPW